VLAGYVNEFDWIIIVTAFLLGNEDGLCILSIISSLTSGGIDSEVLCHLPPGSLVLTCTAIETPFKRIDFANRPAMSQPGQTLREPIWRVDGPRQECVSFSPALSSGLSLLLSRNKV
jgi:hypothetical protein